MARLQGALLCASGGCAELGRDGCRLVLWKILAAFFIVPEPAGWSLGVVDARIASELPKRSEACMGRGGPLQQPHCACT